jgi:heptosyltransferase-3
MNLRLARYIDRWVGLGVCFLLWGLARLLSAGRAVPPLLGTTPPRKVPGTPRRVLAIKFYGLGNIAMILPTLRALRAEGEDVAIDFLTLPGNVALLRQSGLVSEARTVDVSGMGAFLASVLALVRDLREARYDTVLDFEQFMKLSGIFAFLTGAPVRVGFNTDGQARGWLYTHRIAYADTDHMADIFMRLLLPFERAIYPAPRVRLPVAPEARERARALLPAGCPDAVVFHVGTGPNYGKVALKRWSTERFARLADHLIGSRGAEVVFTGVGDEEADLIREVLSQMRHAHGAHSLCDALGVEELTGLLDSALFVVSNDTSIMHLAGLVDTPVVAFFGPTEPRLYGPRGPGDIVFYRGLFCSPCLSNYNLKMSRCVDPVCLKQVSVDEVIARVEERFPLPTRAS